MNLLKLLLLPLMPVYAGIIAFRNLLFDKKILKSKQVNAKVISIGNISIGGSGKTPVVIYLTDLLKRNGINVGVLSRGYGRISNGYLLVSDGKKIFTTVDQSGDEIYHTVLDCKVPAAVSENRVNGANQLVNDTGIDTIVLDDAFQHRWIKRDLDIVVLDQRFLNDKSFFVQNLLPTGILREPYKSIRRADAVIYNRKFMEGTPFPSGLEKYVKDKKVFTGYYKAINFIDLKQKTVFNLDEFKGQKSLVVSGIAIPKSFLNILSQTNVSVTNKLIFRDHKKYSNKDVQLIRKRFYTTNSHSVVTTEKDAVKLMNFSKELDDIEIFYLKIKFVMDDEESFRNFILKN
ncbi:MAG TPA: tetraacyldisaccharide 4'-kinase [Ignavibacteriaceae bacterium]|nr:tetraacyldisaccharide 4'-kinase [Ignavibacteriaceae bacterium]